MHTRTDTSIYLCNSKYCVVYTLHIFRMDTLLYILEDRKSVPMSACFEREQDWSIATVTVVQVFCHLQLKPFLTNIDAQPLLMSIPWKENSECSLSMPMPQTLPWRKSLGSSLICHNSVFCCSVAKPCPTLCNPMGCRRAPSIFQSLLKFMSSELGILSNHLTFCWPFFFCLHSFPASGSFPMSQLFVSYGHRMGASASVLPINNQGWFPLGWTGWISLLSTGLSRVFSSTTVRKHQFFSSQPFFMVQLSQAYMTTAKTIAFILWTFVSKGMSLFTMLSRFTLVSAMSFSGSKLKQWCPAPPNTTWFHLSCSSNHLSCGTGIQNFLKGISRLCVIQWEGDAVGLTQSHWSSYILIGFTTGCPKYMACWHKRI